MLHGNEVNSIIFKSTDEIVSQIKKLYLTIPFQVSRRAFCFSARVFDQDPPLGAGRCAHIDNAWMRVRALQINVAHLLREIKIVRSVGSMRRSSLCLRGNLFSFWVARKNIYKMKTYLVRPRTLWEWFLKLLNMTRPRSTTGGPAGSSGWPLAAWDSDLKHERKIG